MGREAFGCYKGYRVQWYRVNAAVQSRHRGPVEVVAGLLVKSRGQTRCPRKRSRWPARSEKGCCRKSGQNP